MTQTARAGRSKRGFLDKLTAFRGFRWVRPGRLRMRPARRREPKPPLHMRPGLLRMPAPRLRVGRVRLRRRWAARIRRRVVRTRRCAAGIRRPPSPLSRRPQRAFRRTAPAVRRAESASRCSGGTTRCCSQRHWRLSALCRRGSPLPWHTDWVRMLVTVSYTHLTLPTKRIV